MVVVLKCKIQDPDPLSNLVLRINSHMPCMCYAFYSTEQDRAGQDRTSNKNQGKKGTVTFTFYVSKRHPKADN